MRLREKLIHYTNDLGDVDLKQEAIATIEHIAQYMDEDELLHHSRPLALAYLALTEDASVPVVHGRWIIGVDDDDFDVKCSKCEWTDIFEVAGIAAVERIAKTMHYCLNCGAKMDGGDNTER